MLIEWNIEESVKVQSITTYEIYEQYETESEGKPVTKNSPDKDE